MFLHREYPLVFPWLALPGRKSICHPDILCHRDLLPGCRSAHPLPAPNGLSGDTLLNALYGGVIVGFGLALVYRGKGTSGGMDILARIISHRWSVPTSQSYLLTDSATIFVGGLIFGWEKALYAIVMLYTGGISAETVTQGSRIVRTAFIVTDKPEEVSRLRFWTGLTAVSPVYLLKGCILARPRNLLYCVIARSEAERLKSIVAEADPHSFMVIGHGYEALGEGFQSLFRLDLFQPIPFPFPLNPNRRSEFSSLRQFFLTFTLKRK